jgi:CheY-like chemotaxis protein
MNNAKSRKRRGRGRGRGRGKRILVVDDSADFILGLKSSLESEKESRFRVDTYDDPMLALQDFKPGLYDLLLIDFMMAKMSNYQLCDKIRHIDPEIRICYMSGTYPSFEEAREVFPELQTHCFISKPIEMNDLKKRISIELKR